MNDLVESYTVDAMDPQQFTKYKTDSEKLTFFVGSEQWISCENPMEIEDTHESTTHSRQPNQ